MNLLIAHPVELETTPDLTTVVDALVAEMDSAATLKAIQARELTPAPVIETILQIRPTSLRTSTNDSIFCRVEEIALPLLSR
jgi:hypothetical protein